MTAEQLGLVPDDGPGQPVRPAVPPLTRPMRDLLLLLAAATAGGASVLFVEARPTRWHRRATGGIVLDVNRRTYAALQRRGLVAGEWAPAVALTPRGLDLLAAGTGRAVRQGLHPPA